MRALSSLLAFLLLALAGAAQTPAYAVSAIPEQLLKNANAVKRLEVEEFQLVSTHEARHVYKHAVTILNENGDPYAGFYEFYDRFQTIESVEGRLYDREGRLLKKVKMKDMRDESAVSSISLMDDNRVKYHQFYHKDYPYTVEYEVEMSIRQSFHLPYWMPQPHFNYAVQQSRFSVRVPQSYDLRYKALNFEGTPVQTTEGSWKKLVWEVKDLPAQKALFAGPRTQESLPLLRLAPSEFEMQGYRGNMSTWMEFGRFIGSLNKGRDLLPDAVQKKVAELTAGLSTDREKVEALYRFMQQSTRYISIQLGIGGYQPFEAAYVAAKGYGDCKALSNYMYSLLKAAGVRSNYVLVNAGDNSLRMLDDFPMSQFNHAILCVPGARDTIWLECTSQVQPAGYMGSFTGNRKALLIQEDGAAVVSTPRYGMKENTALRQVTARLEGDGSLNLSVQAVYRGEEQEDPGDMLDYLSKEKVKKHLDQKLSLGSYEVNTFSYNRRPAALPEIEEKLTIDVTGYATVSGKRIFIVPNLLNRAGVRLEEEPRTVDFIFSHAYRHEDRAEIELPEGYQLEQGLADLSLQTPYGSYSRSAKMVGNKLVYTRTMEQYSGRFPASAQKEIIKFYDEIYRADRARMVLVK